MHPVSVPPPSTAATHYGRVVVTGVTGVTGVTTEAGPVPGFDVAAGVLLVPPAGALLVGYDTERTPDAGVVHRERLWQVSASGALIVLHDHRAASVSGPWGDVVRDAIAAHPTRTGPPDHPTVLHAPASDTPDVIRCPAALWRGLPPDGEPPEPPPGPFVPEGDRERVRRRAELRERVWRLLRSGGTDSTDGVTVSTHDPGPPDRNDRRAVAFDDTADTRHVDEDLMYVDEDCERAVWVLERTTRSNDFRVARRFPLTPERARVIRDLRVEYEASVWARTTGVGAEAARMLIAAGWDHEHARVVQPIIPLDTADDARAFLDRGLSRWRRDHLVGGSYDWAPFSLRDAERRAEAILSSARAISLRENLDALLDTIDPPFSEEQ